MRLLVGIVLASFVASSASAGDLMNMAACKAGGNAAQVCDCANQQIKSAMQNALPKRHFALLEQADHARIAKELTEDERTRAHRAMAAAIRTASEHCGMRSE